ncbi:MAG: alpha-galactosidase [Bifidobacteriaceae bacterium]|jgi:alpha-galactosidase|nr:alpha-galactosidase [Bifidobacteriaceae bacterium]
MSQLTWGHHQFPLTLTWDTDAPVALSLAPGAARPATAPGPHLAEVLVLGQGRGLTSILLARSAVGDRLRYRTHQEVPDGAWQTLVIEQADPLTGLLVTSRLTYTAGSTTYRATTTVTNQGTEPQVLQAIGSVVLGGLGGTDGLIGQRTEAAVWAARSEWCAESRWYATPLAAPGGLADIDPATHGGQARGTWALTGRSTWPCDGHLPMGALTGPTGQALAWQIEINGPWRWELDTSGSAADPFALALGGPTDLDHAWAVNLEPGQAFTTVPVSFAYSDQGLDGALQQLTRHRRASHRPFTADAARPLVFNDYMNALMGDPTTEKLLPLIEAAAAVGAQVFCIDAGWYDDGGDWWPSVGAWEPSTVRFGELGLTGVLERIRQAGMAPGLWVEPEVVGVESPVASTLPEEAFMHRLGRRIVEQKRYLLDLRSQAARDYLDSVFDRLIRQYGARYFKWDYNVTPGLGPDDAGVLAPGAGLLEHARAHLAWLEQLRARYPEVIFEACSSGAQRMDPATLAYYDLQSTSDQQDYRRYATIAAAAPAIMPPEQAGNWAYPQPEWDLEQTAFTLVTGLSGRLYLSGHPNRLSAAQLALVQEAAALYPAVINHHVAAVPTWPLGLPGWDDSLVALATVADGAALVFVWHRPTATSPKGLAALPLADWAGATAKVETVFPTELAAWPATWDATSGTLNLNLDGIGEAARVFRLTRD